MTREEAINAFEEIKVNAQTHLGKKYAVGCEGYYRNKIELSDAALTALRGPTREMVEKMRGEWETTKRDKATFICSGCGHLYGAFIAGCANFCPACGRPMTDEAVEIRLKELEALKDD